MADKTAEINTGLEGVVVAASELSLVDGTNGRLVYRGYNIDELATNATFEEVMYLLWYGDLPTQAQLDELTTKLKAARKLSPAVKQALQSLPHVGAPIDAIRAGITVMGMEHESDRELNHDRILEQSIKMAGAIPSMLAAYLRLREGKDIIEPRADLSEAGNFLYMLLNEEPTQVQADAFNTYLTLVTEHSMNASTFATRVTFSTIVDTFSAISSGLGTLKGDAHGGANMRAMEMLLDIGSVDKADEYIEESLRIKRRLMGIGHRVYRTRDPRAKHLMGYSEAVGKQKDNLTWHNIAERIETITNEHEFFVERKLFPNVEFYSAPLLYTLGLPTDAMPGAFAISRVVGWTANLLEQEENKRLIRPKAEYVGPDNLKYKPIDQRG